MKRPLGPAAFLAFAAALPLSLAACGDLLSLKDLQPYPAEGGADGSGDEASADDGGGDGGSDATGSDARDGEGTLDGSMPGDGPETTDGSSKDSSSSDGPATDAPEDTSHPVDAPFDAPADTGSVPDSSCTLGTTKDCRFCGNDCLFGTCTGGLCQPFTIASSVKVNDMVVSGSTLYWADLVSTVWSCTIAGNTCNAKVFAANQSSPERIALGGVGKGTVFWTNFGSGGAADGSIAWLPLAGGTNPNTLASGQWTPQGIAADSTNVFWADTVTNQLVRGAIAGGTPTTFATGSGTLPTPVAVGGGTVYWGNDIAGGNGAVDMSPESAFNIGLVQGTQASPWAFALDSTYLYWVDYVNPGSVWQYTVNGGGKQQLASSENRPVGVSSDLESVFWIDEGDSGGGNGTLTEWTVSTGTKTPRAQGQNQPYALTMDANAVYFATIDGNIHMMVR